MGDWTKSAPSYCLMGAMRAPVWPSPRRFARLPGRISGMKSSMCSDPRISNAHTPSPPCARRRKKHRSRQASRCSASAYHEATNAPQRRGAALAEKACRESATPSVGAWDARVPTIYGHHSRNGRSRADQAPDRAEKSEALPKQSPRARSARVPHSARDPHPLLRIQPGTRRAVTLRARAYAERPERARQ